MASPAEEVDVVGDGGVSVRVLRSGSKGELAREGAYVGASRASARAAQIRIEVVRSNHRRGDQDSLLTSCIASANCGHDGLRFGWMGLMVGRRWGRGLLGAAGEAGDCTERRGEGNACSKERRSGVWRGVLLSVRREQSRVGARQLGPGPSRG